MLLVPRLRTRRPIGHSRMPPSSLTEIPVKAAVNVAAPIVSTASAVTVPARANASRAMFRARPGRVPRLPERLRLARLRAADPVPAAEVVTARAPRASIPEPRRAAEAQAAPRVWPRRREVATALAVAEPLPPRRAGAIRVAAPRVSPRVPRWRIAWRARCVPMEHASPAVRDRRSAEPRASTLIPTH
jgi:hypothetical protein